MRAVRNFSLTWTDRPRTRRAASLLPCSPFGTFSASGAGLSAGVVWHHGCSVAGRQRPSLPPLLPRRSAALHAVSFAKGDTEGCSFVYQLCQGEFLSSVSSTCAGLALLRLHPRHPRPPAGCRAVTSRSAHARCWSGLTWRSSMALHLAWPFTTRKLLPFSILRACKSEIATVNRSALPAPCFLRPLLRHPLAGSRSRVCALLNSGL